MSGRGVVAVRAAFGLALLPLVLGVLTVTYQDAAMTHLPGKWASVEQLRSGRFPFVNPYASFGQPLAGNPNFGTFFPDTLLFLALPLTAAFGAHFALAGLLAWAGARRWARAEGAGRGAAEAAGAAFALSGVFVSAWKFYNTGLALAVAPWVLAAAVKLAARAGSGVAGARRRAACELGLWGALEVFAGEPVVALLTFALVVLRSGWHTLVAWRAADRDVSRRLLGWTSAALLLAALLSAPQTALTAQMWEGSSRYRKPYPFVTATGTSLHPARLLEQAVPFPFGRPDLTGAGRFSGHAFSAHHVPYLWTLHLGWATLGLLALYGRLGARGERGYWLVAFVAIVLSFGRYLPGAKKLLYPLLSLGGHIRFPVKWWYVVALALVPLVARAGERWLSGAPPRRAGVWPLVLLPAGVGFVAAWWGMPTELPWAAVGVSAAGLAVLLSAPARLRSPGLLVAALAVPLLVAALPLLLAVLDRPAGPPPRLGAGRVFERVRVEVHPRPGEPPPPEKTMREVFRRVRPELWAISGALAGNVYAFDRDPDGSYSDLDRVVRKAVDDLPWPERAPILRQGGVAHVVTDEALPPPYREVAVLSPVHDVRLYRLPDDVPAVRLAAEVPGAGQEGEQARVESVRESAGTLSAEVRAPRPAVLVWSRTFFSAWKAEVDGRPAPTLVADGHVLGVPVPAGSHRVEVHWSVRPMAFGLAACALGLAIGAALWSRRVISRSRSGGT